MDYTTVADVRLSAGLINIISCFSHKNQEKMSTVSLNESTVLRQPLEPLLLLAEVGFVFLEMLWGE